MKQKISEHQNEKNEKAIEKAKAVEEFVNYKTKMDARKSMWIRWD